PSTRSVEGAFDSASPSAGTMPALRRRARPDVAAPIRVAEFFAGVGLVRLALERHGCSVVFANDVDATKRRIYAANFPADDFRLCDVRTLTGGDVPDVDVATASFPCTDLS